MSLWLEIRTLEKFLVKSRELEDNTIQKPITMNFEKSSSQILSTSATEQIFHYSKVLQNRVRTEMERSEFSNLQVAIILADRVESLFSNTYSSFGMKGSYIEKTQQQ